MDELLFAIRYSPFAERAALTACFVSLSFAGLVVLARSLNPIPSRTRPLNSSAPMVLWLKPWESRSLPGLPRTKQFLFTCHDQKRRFLREAAFFYVCWSASCAAVARLFGHDLQPERCFFLTRIGAPPASCRFPQVHGSFISKFV